MKVASSSSLLYNPGRIPQEELLALFTVRENEFRIIWENILHTEPRSSDQNFLVTGQRGMGKTTLLLKVAYEIQREPRLKDWLIPVVFPEELYGVRSLIDLWIKTAEVLDSRNPDLFPKLLAEIEKAGETMNDSGVLNTLFTELDKGGYKLVLFIDNFGDLLARLPDLEVRRLRSILMSTRHIRLIAASARVIDQTYEYDKPLLDFFYNIHLQDLKKDEAYQLIRSLAAWRLGTEEAADNWLNPIQDRIEPIRRLTGGSPRMLVLLMKALMENDAEELLPTMEAILDQVTPYYKHIVEDLKPQQQEIFHATAMAWDAVTSGEIAQSLKLDSKKVSAQMLQLEAIGLLEKVPLDNKNNLYRLQDRFFNIWYLMRMAGYKGLARLKYLLKEFVAAIHYSTPVQSMFDGKLATTRKQGYYDSHLENEEGLFVSDIDTPYGNNERVNDIEKAIDLLKGNRFSISTQIFSSSISNLSNLPPRAEAIRQYLLLLLVKYQLHTCLQLFEESPHPLKDFYKPIWYALMKLLGPEKKKDFLRMGPELAETVDEIVDTVLRMREKYR